MRYFIELSYFGKPFHGWQIQPNAVTIQATIENALAKVLRKPSPIVGAGRTDTGVHATFFVAHFETKTKITDTDKLLYSLNAILPKAIAIEKIYEVPKDLHARFSALSRTYEYRVVTQKSPFLQEYAYRLYGNIDFETMNKAAKRLFDYTDFTSFSKLHTDAFTNDCTILEAHWTVRDNQHIFTIKANRFLRNMVRAITGTLFEVGKGKISTDDFCKIIEAKNRQSAGVSVPAHGLYLTGIEYPNFAPFTH